MDKLTKEQRHRNMMANKSRGTKIELLLAHMLWNAGIRYRKNDGTLPGTPDFTIRGLKIAIFCDGEFWHGRDWDENKERIKTNRQFWYAKIERNQRRDAEVTQQLADMGWKVFRFWETDIRREPDRCLNEIVSYVHGIRNSLTPPSETFGSACGTINVYGPHSYNRDGSIMSVNDQMAVLSHYLHNYGSSSAEPFADLADGLMEDIREDAPGCTDVADSDLRHQLSAETFGAPFARPQHTRFTFAELFAGIGAVRMALQPLGGRCVFASEWDAQAVRQYFANFGQAPFGDITREETKTYIPQHFDMLTASLPLQAFALAHRRSAADKIRGTLFAEVADILRRREPRAVLIECPAAQQTHARGSALQIMLDVLRRELGYTVPEPQQLDAADFGTACHASCLYIAGFRDPSEAERFAYPAASAPASVISDIIESRPVSARYYLTSRSASSASAAAHLVEADAAVLCRGIPLVRDERTTDMLPSTKKLDRINRDGIRRVTPREMARLRGLPDDYRIRVADREAYRLLSASSPVPVVRAVAENMARCMNLTSATFRY